MYVGDVTSKLREFDSADFFFQFEQYQQTYGPNYLKKSETKTTKQVHVSQIYKRPA